MNTLIACIHGILTGQTRPSWPDEFDSWVYRREPRVKVLKKEYSAGPFPRWNCLVKNPLLATGIACEIELFLRGSGDRERRSDNPEPNRIFKHLPSTWFLAHSNGAVIALEATQRLIARGYWVAGLILTGAACEADVVKNQVASWLEQGRLGTAIAYCSPDDKLLPVAVRRPARLPEVLWRMAVHPYGSLGRTGWLMNSRPVGEAGEAKDHDKIKTRWFTGGHSTYFHSANLEATFEQIMADISAFVPSNAAAEVTD